jgi:tRNA A37 threonylcarbamoyladenosine biosynthesis protein TsaE
MVARSAFSPLGCGKTTLVRAVLRTLTGSDSLVVPSPTFLLDVCYPFRTDTEESSDDPLSSSLTQKCSFTAVHHMDLYRVAPSPQSSIEQEQELAVLSLDRIFRDGMCVY